jgi:DeoR/GlpR family transcriptional regulator of sugar metabolism
METRTKQRLKRQELVTRIFYLFSEVYERNDQESIWDIELPIGQIRKHLKSRYEIDYNSDQWIYTQLRRYEEEIGVKLFRKIRRPGSHQSFSIAVYDGMTQFHQKQHLYVSEKIKVANGVYDKIRNTAMGWKGERAVRLLLGAGSTVYHLSRIIADKSWEDDTRFSIYTHNLGSLQSLLGHNVNFDRITVSILSGKVDPVTYTVVGDDTSLISDSEFDFIIQGTSCVYDGLLFIESRTEHEVKKTILQRCRGTKILVLTKHEFLEQPIPDVEPYGSIGDYDYVVVPRSGSEGAVKKKYERRFERYEPILVAEILNWNYSIYKVARAAAAGPT